MDESVSVGGGELEIIHKRTKVINHDNNIDLILAGRARKISIEVPEEPKYCNQRMQKIVIESENQYIHLLGEVTGEKYGIHGRPELELMQIAFSPKPPGTAPRIIKKFEKRTLEEDDDSETIDDASRGEPSGSLGIQILFYSTQTAFIFSPKTEDRLLAFLKDYPGYDLVVQSSGISFGEYEFSTLDRIKPRLWRRFVREYLIPQLNDEERMILMEDRLNFEILYTDDMEVKSDDDSTSEEEEEEEEKTKKKRKKKKGGKKKDVAAAPPTVGISSKEVAAVAPSTSARVQQRLSVKKGVGLLAKRASAIKVDGKG